MLPVAQTPIVRYPLEWLRAGGVRSVIVCANDAIRSVRAHVGDGSGIGLAVDYVEDREPRGAAGCAHDAARRSPAQTFIVVEGAMIPSLDIAALLSRHRASRADATIVVEIERRRGPFSEDAPRLPGGVYVFERRVLEAVPARGYQDIKQGVLERLYAARQHVAVHEVPGISPRVLDYASYAAVNAWQIGRSIEQRGFLKGYVRSGEALIHPTALVHAGARFIGPVLVGADSRVQAGAVIVGPSTIGSGSSIGGGAVLSRSITWDGCMVGEDAVVTDSLLADRAEVEAGAHLAGALRLGASETNGGRAGQPARWEERYALPGLGVRLRAATAASFAFRSDGHRPGRELKVRV
ncbi:MAG: NDP-sugar synthase [Gemmatimonadaceae bacterium]